MPHVRVHREVDVAQHLDAPELLRNIRKPQERCIAHRQLRSTPMMPCLDSRATAMNSAPSSACQRSVHADRDSLRRMMAKAPMIGPHSVPAPPTITISRTCPDVVIDSRSGLTKEPNHANSAPAVPLIVPEMTNAPNRWIQVS